MMVLQATNLRKSFVTRRSVLGRPRERLLAVDGVDLQIEEHQTLGLVGESGSGKSTTARLVTRLIEPDDGRIVIDGADWTSLRPTALRRARRSAQLVFQDPYASLDPTKTIADVIAEPLVIHERLRGAAKERRVLELLDMVELTAAHARRYPYEFSGGQRQRIAIARALAAKPKLVIADEAVSALDVSTQAQVLNLLLDLQAEHGLAYLFISHDLGVVHQMSDRIAVMYLGRIVEEGPAEAVYSAPAHPYTRALISAVPEIDPGQRRARVRLEGEPPSPTSTFAGCAFQPRCPDALDVCATVPPPTIRAGDVEVVCHLHAGAGQPVEVRPHDPIQRELQR